MANDSLYTLGVEIDSTDLDAFIQRVKSLGSSTSFGRTFKLPQGVTGSGPGIRPNGNTNISTGPQALAFADAARVGLESQLRALKQGGLKGQEYLSTKREVDAVVRALAAGARAFEARVGSSNVAPPQSVLAVAQRESRQAIDASLAESEQKEIRNAKRRQATAAKKTATNEEQSAQTSEQETQTDLATLRAKGREAKAAAKAADSAERRAARYDAQRAAAPPWRTGDENTEYGQRMRMADSREAARARAEAGRRSEESRRTEEAALRAQTEVEDGLVTLRADDDLEKRAVAARAKVAKEAIEKAESPALDADEAARLAKLSNDELKKEAAARRKSAQAAQRDAEQKERAAGGGGAAPPPKPPPGPPDDPDDPDGEDRKSKARSTAAKKRKAATDENVDKLSRAEQKAIDDALGLKAKELSALKVRLAVAQQTTSTDRQIAKVKAEILVAEMRQARLEREQNQAAFARARQADPGFFAAGTRTQRLQAAIHSRDGRIIDPLGEKTLGSLIGTRVFQASSFALGGLAFYGALQVIRDTMQEVEALEREFFVVQGQIERTFGDEAEKIFNRFKDRVRDIAQSTGQLGSEVAFVARQLSAAFVDSAADPGESDEAFRARQGRQFDLALDNTDIAFKFAEVTNLDPKEITDSLTALGLSFTDLNGDFSGILNNAIALEEEFGVLGGQIITFAADLAPLAANLGFTAEQLTELGAVAQKYSGRGGGALAEQFGRILTDLPTKAADLIALFSQTPELADLSSGLADAFVAENMQQVLQFILQAASRVQRQNLDPGLISSISETVAGRREGASFAAILRSPDELLGALQTENVRSLDAVDKRWQAVRRSLVETLERLKRSVEQLAEALLSAGLADAMKLVANGLNVIATTAGGVIRAFDRLNDITGGLLGTFGSLYLMIKSVDVALRVIGTSQALTAILPGLAGASGRAAASGGATGLLSRLAKGAPGFFAGGGAASLLGRIGTAGTGLLSGLGARALGGALTSTYLPPLAGGLGVAAGVAAPAAAAASLVLAKNELDNLRAGIRSQGDALRVQAQSATFAELISGLQASQTDTRIFGIPGTSSIGTWALGGAGALPENIVRDVFTQRAGPELLGVGLSALSGAELTENQAKGYELAIAEVEKALAGEDANLEGVTRFIEEISENRSDLGQAIGQAMTASAEAQAAADEVTSGSSGPQFQQLLAALGAGRTTPEAVRRALGVAIEPLQVLADSALKAGDYTAYLAQMESIAQLQQAADQGISQYISNTVNFAEQIRTLFGDSTPDTRAANAIQILQDPNVTDNATRLQALEALQGARDDAFQARLDAARNEEERLRILEEGRGVDPIAQAEAIYQQVEAQIQAKLAELNLRQASSAGFRATGLAGPVEDFTDEIEALEGLTQEQIAAISEQLIQDIETYGQGAISIRLGLLRARAEELATAIRYTGRAGGDTSALEAQRAQILEQIGIYEGLEASGVDPTDIVTDDGKPSPTEQEEIDRKRRQLDRDRQLAIINRARAAAAGDPVREAQLAQQAAQVSLEYARTEFGPDSIEAINAEAELISARQQARSAAKELALAQIAVAQAYAAGDPVAEASLSIRAAQIAGAYAQGPVEALQAQAQLVAAYNQAREAQNDIQRAQLELLIAQAAGDPVRQAQLGLQQADLAIQQARGTAERLRAQASRVAADRALQDAIQDITQSQIELAIALAEAGGDTVEAAQLRLSQAQDQLNYLLRTSPQDEASINRARADVAGATRAYQDSVLDKQRTDIDFALEMGRITTGQAIESYRMLLQIPTNTEEQNRELELAIRRLQESAQQDFQFNLPTNLQLPTLYEARRLNQSPNGFQDNRVITINLNASTSADAQTAATTIINTLNGGSLYGTRPRLY